MVGSLAVLLLAVWYFTSAKAKQEAPIKWVAIGLGAYFLAATLWTFLVTPSLRDSVEHNQSYILGFIVRYGYVVVGVLFSFWVKFKHLGSNN